MVMISCSETPADLAAEAAAALVEWALNYSVLTPAAVKTVFIQRAIDDEHIGL